MKKPWRLTRGATVKGNEVRFAVWAPRAKRVEVIVCGKESGSAHQLERDENGVFSASLSGEGFGHGTLYRYRLDGAREVPDPVSRYLPSGVHGPSMAVDPRRFEWTDSGWKGMAMRDYVLYELHVGTFTPEGTFEAVIPKLAELGELGITAVELMPVCQFPGSRNWGYDGVAPYAPQNSYGGPDALRRLVNAAHSEGLAVVLDVVYNHLGPEGNYLSAFGPYFTDRYDTPWGQAVNFDGADSDEVRRYVTDNIHYWVSEYHIDGFRLDAVHHIYDFSARHILADIAEAAHAEGRRYERTVCVIAESDLNDPRLIRDSQEGGFGLDAQWSDDLHHAVHATITGERGGYYGDFTGGVPQIAKALSERFVYDGVYSPVRRRRHGARATDLPADRFVVSLQNHDQVGNRAAGDRVATLVSFEQLKLAASILLLSPYVPMLFMGEEHGETNPFLYFVSHTDPDLIAAVREGRRREFEGFAWGDEVPDPEAESSFVRSRVDWARASQPDHVELRTFYRDLLHLRADERALKPGDARARVEYDQFERWIALELVPSRASTLLLAFNFSDEERRIPIPGNESSRWRVVLSSSDIRYTAQSERRGSPLRSDSGVAPNGRNTPRHGEVISGRTIILPPTAAVVWRRESV